MHTTYQEWVARLHHKVDYIFLEAPLWSSHSASPSLGRDFRSPPVGWTLSKCRGSNSQPGQTNDSALSWWAFWGWEWCAVSADCHQDGSLGRLFIVTERQCVTDWLVFWGGRDCCRIYWSKREIGRATLGTWSGCLGDFLCGKPEMANPI